MKPFDEYIEHADELAQKVVNTWGVNFNAKNAPLFTADFNALFEEACRYRNEKDIAEAYRNLKKDVVPDMKIPQEVLSREEAAKKSFAAVFRDFEDKGKGIIIMTMPARRIVDMRVYYNASRPVTVGDRYYQLVCRESDAGFEVGVYHGELKSQQKAASPNDPLKLTFPSDVAEYYLLDSQTKAEADFKTYCEETQTEGYQPYNPAIHGT